MKQCKKCKAVISLDLADLMREFPSPKAVSKDSVIKGYCRECFEAKKR